MKQRFLSVCAALFALMALYCATARAADNVYAILYDDGTLVFQYGNTPESGKNVVKTYEVDLDAFYRWHNDNSSDAPWYNERESIRVVNFADKISPTGTSYWFYSCTKLERIDNIQNLDTSNVTRMHDMFSGCHALKELDVSHFDTANVTIMQFMFAGCRELKELDVSKFNTAKVTSMYAMFRSCSGLTTLDVSNFNTEKVTSMVEMFRGCSKLTELDVSHFNTTNVTNMSYMFAGCSDLTELDVSHFDTANVTDMESMFSDCSGLKTIYASDKFTTASVPETTNDNSHNMFSGCASLVGGNRTKYNSKYLDKKYARIDTPSAPGYFTDGLQTYIITSYAGEGGAVTPDGDTRVRVGASQKYVITPNPGWRVLSVRMDGVEIGPLSEHVFKNVAANHNLVALFERLPYYAITAAVARDGELSVTLENTDVVTVAVWYSDRNGKFLSADMRTASANAGNVTFELPFAYKARVALFDSAYRPLCDPVTVR